MIKLDVVFTRRHSRIVPNVGVKSYPVVDRYGLLWIWMGDVSAADPDEIIHIENYDNPNWGKTASGSMDIACHYLYVTDNLLDPSHVAWVHVSSFAGGGTEDVPLKVDKLEDGVVVSRWMQNREPPPYYAPMLKFKGNCDCKNSITNAGCHRSLSTSQFSHRLARVVMMLHCPKLAL